MRALTAQQEKIVQEIRKPTLVIAGAGSGKTLTICEKISYLATKGHSQKILAITFTNKAARQMRDRLKHYAFNQRHVFVSTFHSFGLKIIEKFGHLLGYQNNFSIVDQQDKIIILEEIAPGIDQKAAKDLLYQISWLKQLTSHKGLDPVEFSQALEIFPRYQQALEQTNCLDLDDLVYQAWRLSYLEPVRQKILDTFDYWFIDEYQDTNLVQYHLFKNLSRAYRFTLVGDDDQSIYTWRGANPENLTLLSHDFPDLEVIALTTNFRSSPEILAAANTLIAHNSHLFEKTLQSALPSGKRLKLITPVNEDHEAEDILDLIMNYKEGTQAILVRTNYQIMHFEKALRERGLPYQLLGAQSLFNKSELRDLLSYLRFLVNPDDLQAFKRVINTPKRGIGPQSVEKIIAWAQQHEKNLYQASQSVGLLQSLPEKTAASVDHFFEKLNKYYHLTHQSNNLDWIEDLLNDIGYDDWLDSQTSKKKALDKKRESLSSFLKWLQSLYQKTPDLDKVLKKIMIIDRLEHEQKTENQPLTLSTMHAAKGLEFDRVSIAGVIEDLLPHQQSLESIEEERRLFYVGITRAKSELVISAPEAYMGKEALESRFIKEIGPEHFGPQQLSLSFDDLRKSVGC